MNRLSWVVSTIGLLCILLLMGCPDDDSTSTGPDTGPGSDRDVSLGDLSDDASDDMSGDTLPSDLTGDLASDPSSDGPPADQSDAPAADSGNDGGLDADAGDPTEVLVLTPNGAQRGTSSLTVRLDSAMTFVEGMTTVEIPFESGAAISDITWVDDHQMTLQMEIANDAQLGSWTIRAETTAEISEGSFEIRPREAIASAVVFVPSALTRGESHDVRLEARGGVTFDEATVASFPDAVSFPEGAGISLTNPTLDGQSAIDLTLSVAADAPLGEITATVDLGLDSWPAALTIVDSGLGLRVTEIMTDPVTSAQYFELTQLGGDTVSTVGVQLLIDGGAELSLPTAVLEPGDILVLASTAGVPFGPTIQEGLVFSARAGALTLVDGEGTTLDSIAWDLDRDSVGAGRSLVRTDPVASGALAESWRAALTLLRAPDTSESWSADRGSPGRPTPTASTGGTVNASQNATEDFISQDDLLLHAWTAQSGDYRAVEVDVNLIAGSAQGVFYAVDSDTDAALTPTALDSDFSDAWALLAFPSEATSTPIPIEIRVWSDPVYLFDPTNYTLSVYPATGITANRIAFTLSPDDLADLATTLVFDDIDDGGDPLTLEVFDPATEFAADDTDVALVRAEGDAWVIEALDTGSTTITITLPQSDGAVVGSFDVLVGDNDASSDTCAEPHVDLVLETPVTNQSTVNAGEDYSPDGGDGCPGGFFTYGDRVYRFVPSTTATFRVTVTPTTAWDPLVYIRTDCEGSTCVAGTNLNGEHDPEGSSGAESVATELTAEMPYFIIVDGIVDEGGFEIVIAQE